MPRSTAKTPDEYLAQLPADRRAELVPVRDLVRRHLPKGYAETMAGGMIVWVVPLEHFAGTGKGDPLWYAALAAQKNFNTLYLMAAYADSEAFKALKAAFAKAGKKFDMGKSCLHFKRAEDLELEAVGTVIASMPMKEWIATFQRSRAR